MRGALLTVKGLFGSQLRVNVLSGVGSMVVSTAVLAVAYPLYLHFLGKEQYGVWLLLSSVVSLLQLSSLGLSPALTKLVAEATGNSDPVAAQEYIDTSLVAMTAVGLLVVGLLTVAAEPLVSWFDLTPRVSEVAVSLVPVMGVLSVYAMTVQGVASVLSGLGRIDLANFAQAMGRLATLFSSGVFLWCDWGLFALVIGTAFGSVVTQGLCLILTRRVSSLKVGTSVRAFRKSRLKELMFYGTAVLGTSLIAMLFDPLNKIILARYSGVAGIPIYDIAFRASMHLRSVFDVGLRALMPEVSRIGAVVNDMTRAKIVEIVRKSLRVILVVGGGVYLLTGAFSEPLLNLWLGKQYETELLGVFRVMLLGSFISLIGVPAYHTLMARGRAYRCLIATAIPAVTNVVFVAALVLITAMSPTPIWLASSMLIGSIGATMYLSWEYSRQQTWER